MEAIHRPTAVSKDRAQGPFRSARVTKTATASFIPAIRTALLKDIRLFEFLMANAGALRRRQPSALHYLARRCMQWQEVEQLKEGEVCRYLGCTVAARLERLAPSMPEEDAAVFGILVEVAYSYLAGVLSIADFERTVRLIDALGFNLFAPELYALSTDAIRRSKQERPTPLMLLKGIGQGAEQQITDPSLMDHAVRLIESWGGEAVHWAGAANET